MSLMEEGAGWGRVEIMLSDSRMHTINDIKLPRGTWFHYAATYDGMITKVHTGLHVSYREDWVHEAVGDGCC